MRIIKEGKIPDKKVILKCLKCGTIFEAKDGEYFVNAIRVPMLYKDTNEYSATCPLCGYEGLMQKMKYEYVEV